jgi:uncharacterized protein (DUF983 family)
MECRPRWEAMTLTQRDAVIDRISNAAGISKIEAVQRVSNPGCPRCGGSDMDRGAVDVCRNCSCVSKEGIKQ